MLFAKSISSVCSVIDHVAIPAHATKLDWELEIAVIIGSAARHVSEADALPHVAGSCLSVEFAERA